MSETKGFKFASFLLISVITMFFAEGLIMSSSLWFVNPWSLIVTFPLYAFHLIFLLNLAMRSGKTSLGHLYLFGVLFSLYESWITKVLWYGDPGENSVPIWGIYFGISIFEFLTLVLFYHPVFSFIMPIMIYQFIVYRDSKDTKHLLPGHIEYLGSNIKKSYNLIIFFLLWPVSFLAVSLGGALPASTITIIGSWFLIFIVLAIARNRNAQLGQPLSIHDLRLGDKGMRWVLLYLSILYLLLFIGIPPAPNAILPYVLIFLSYFIVIRVLKKSPTNMEIEKKSSEVYSFKLLYFYLISIILLPYFFLFFLPLGQFLMLVINLLMIMFGIFYFTKLSFGGF